MKNILLAFLLISSFNAFSQTVSFKADSIIIDSKLCLHFNKINDTFYVRTLDDKNIIEWQVLNISPGKFSTTYFFPTINEQLHIDDINGRNAIIFLLIKNDILINCELNEKRLVKFIDKHRHQ